MVNNTKQTTNSILMIEPVSFGFNDQTAANNFFQQKGSLSEMEIQSCALSEFTHMVDRLSSLGIDIIVVKDTLLPNTPDSIFPNNWISFHRDGRMALYPMYAENRRAERRKDIYDILIEKGFIINDIVDYTSYEKQNCFLEGTGSMIFDHEHQIAYAAISERTEKKLFLQFCNDFKFKPVYFRANQTVNGKRLPIYHTNVMMCVGDKYSVICLDSIDDTDERNTVIKFLVNSGKKIIEISEKQMHSFAGNMLQVKNHKDVPFIVMSQSTFDSLTRDQIGQLNSYNEIISIAIPTIEKYGGGSVRCMMAEVFCERL